MYEKNGIVIVKNIWKWKLFLKVFKNDKNVEIFAPKTLNVIQSVNIIIEDLFNRKYFSEIVSLIINDSLNRNIVNEMNPLIEISRNELKDFGKSKWKSEHILIKLTEM